MFQSKLAALLRSRKFWASVIGLVSVLVLNFTGATLPDDLLVEAIVAIVGVFVAATAVEDGLARRA